MKPASKGAPACENRDHPGTPAVRGIGPGNPANRYATRYSTRSPDAADTLGDVIIAANGEAVHKLSDLVDQLEKTGIGHKVQLELRRGNQSRTIDVDVVDISRTS